MENINKSLELRAESLEHEKQIKAEIEEIKAILKHDILWYLDDIDCHLAIEKSRALSACVDAILKDLTDFKNLDTILYTYKKIFEKNGDSNKV